MAPTSSTPTPTTNKRGGVVAAAAPPAKATSTVTNGATMRTPPQSRQKPLRTSPSQRQNGDIAVVRTPRANAVERLVDELSGTPSHDTNDRQEAFESARKKFAMYGKQNAHVSHYSPDLQKAQKRQRALNRRASGAASTAPVRRTVAWEDTKITSNTAKAAALQNTVLLQENGELAAQLDDMEYHLDGILASSTCATVATEESGFAVATSVVALTKLLQLEPVQTVLKVASQSQQLNARLRDVLLQLKSIDHRLLKLSVAVMAYLLTVNADADEFFSADVIDTVVTALGVECQLLGGDCSSSSSSTIESIRHETISSTGQESKTPLKKSFLKRKKSRVDPRPSTVEDVVLERQTDENKVERAREFAQREEEVLAELRALLSSQDVFMVDGQIQLSTADLLCMLLHNVLQVGGASGDDGSESSTRRSTKQPPLRRFFHQHQELAGTTFETIRTRKHHLIRNGGLALLIEVLEKRFGRLQQDLGDDLVHMSVSLDVACAFQRVRTMLRVLDQASFLATDVQLQMSKQETVFRVTLRLIEVLSELVWSSTSRKKWQSDPSFMYLVVDVLMAAMRVLINLSHQNEDANRHIAKLEGTRILFLAFCKLWGTVKLEQVSESGSKEQPHLVEDRVVYDALLLTLSAITNCVEYSIENRAQLSTLDLSSSTLEGLTAFQSSSPCSLLVSFFLSKVQSYIHLFELSDSQREMEEATWVPEDVVLGGCASLLLGCLMKDSTYNSATILMALPDASPQLLLRALGAFVALHSQIGALTPEVGKSVLEVEKLLKSSLAHEGEPSSGPEWSVGTANPMGQRTNSILQTAVTVHLNVTPRRERRFEVEEVKGEVSNHDESEHSQPSLGNQQSVQSPPASAFRLQRFSRVCSNVDDSDDVVSDVERSPMKKRRVATTPKSPCRSPARTKVTVNATVTSTPIRRVSNAAAMDNRSPLGGDGVKTSIQRRLKRTHQLVSDLEAEFVKIGSRVSNEISTAAIMTTTEDASDGDRFDLSQRLFSTDEAIAVKQTPQKAAKKSRSKVLLLKTPTTSSPLRKRVQTPVTSRKPAQVPPITHKRKIKATPAKPMRKVVATEETDAVFDFDG